MAGNKQELPEVLVTVGEVPTWKFKNLKETRKAKLQAHTMCEENGLLVWLWYMHYYVIVV